MKWESSRKVPWRRLVKEYLVYIGIIALIFLAAFRDRPLQDPIIGLVVSMPVYLMIGYVMAKCGFEKKSMSQIRTERAATRRGAAPANPLRPRPAATRRTGAAGPSRPGQDRRAQRRK